MFAGGFVHYEHIVRVRAWWKNLLMITNNAKITGHWLGQKAPMYMLQVFAYLLLMNIAMYVCR